MLSCVCLACEQALYSGLKRDLFWARAPILSRPLATRAQNKFRETQIESLLAG